MFTSLGSFGIFFFTGLLLVVLGFIFEDRLVEFEQRVFKKLASRKEQRDDSPFEVKQANCDRPKRRCYSEYVA